MTHAADDADDIGCAPADTSPLTLDTPFWRAISDQKSLYESRLLVTDPDQKICPS